ncbi:MAG: hypothetical protein AAF449_09415, partial [Myxococcota bacterium]
ALEEEVEEFRRELTELEENREVAPEEEYVSNNKDKSVQTNNKAPVSQARSSYETKQAGGTEVTGTKQTHSAPRSAQLLDDDSYVIDIESEPTTPQMALSDPSLSTEQIDQLAAEHAGNHEVALLIAYHPNASAAARQAVSEADNGIRIVGDEVHLHDESGESYLIHNTTDNTLAMRHVHDDHPDASDYTVFQIMEDGTLSSLDSDQFDVFSPDEFDASMGSPIVLGDKPVLLEGDPEDYAYQGVNDQGFGVFLHIETGAEIHIPDEHASVVFGHPDDDTTGDQGHRNLRVGRHNPSAAGLRNRFRPTVPEEPGVIEVPTEAPPLGGGLKPPPTVAEIPKPPPSIVEVPEAAGGVSAVDTVGSEALVDVAFEGAGVVGLIPGEVYFLYTENQMLQNSSVDQVQYKFPLPGGGQVLIDSRYDSPELRLSVLNTYEHLMSQNVSEADAAHYIQSVLNHPTEVQGLPDPSEASLADLTTAFLNSIDRLNSTDFAAQYTDPGPLTSPSGLSLDLPAEFEHPAWREGFQRAFDFMVAEGVPPDEANRVLNEIVSTPGLQEQAHKFYGEDYDDAGDRAAYSILVEVGLADNGISGLSEKYAAQDGTIAPVGGTSPGEGMYPDGDVDEFQSITDPEAAAGILFDELSDNSPENVAMLLEGALDDPQRLGAIFDNLLQQAQASAPYDGGQRLEAVQALFGEVFNAALVDDGMGGMALPSDAGPIVDMLTATGGANVAALTSGPQSHPESLEAALRKYIEAAPSLADKLTYILETTVGRAAAVLAGMAPADAAAILQGVIDRGHVSFARNILNAMPMVAAQAIEPLLNFPTAQQVVDSTQNINIHTVTRRNAPNQFTPNGMYGVRDTSGVADGHYSASTIWVRADAEAPLNTKPTGRKFEKDGHTYYEFEQAGEYYQDCLNCAEELMVGNQLPYGEADQSRVSGGNQVFGTPSEADRGRIRTWAQNNPGQSNQRATPAIGQAYAIMPAGPRSEGGYPYHAAAVVATDGTSTITLETSAGSQDSTSRGATLQFHIYSNAPNSGQTFHDHWLGDFGDDATPIVLEPIPDRKRGGQPEDDQAN